MKKTFTWETTHKFVLEAEYSEKLVEKVHYLDGDEIHTGKMEKKENAYIAIYVDGKKLKECCLGTNWWRLIDVKIKEGYKRIWGLDGVAFSPETAEKIEAFLAEVKAEGKDEAVTAFEAEKKAKEIAEKIESYEEIIKAAEKQADIPTRKEAKARMKHYNDIHNEGGEGYVPYIISLEEYEQAKQKLAELRSQI